MLEKRLWTSWVGGEKPQNKPELEKSCSILGSVGGSHCLGGISATPLWVVKLLLGSFRDQPNSSFDVCGCGLNLLSWNTFASACSLSQGKLENYHLGSDCFPNLPVWSIWQGAGSLGAVISRCLLLENISPRKKCLVLCTISELSSLTCLCCLSFSSPWHAEKDKFRDEGREREKRKGGTGGGEQETLEWGNGWKLGSELGVLRSDRKVSWLETIDRVLT